MHVVFAKSYCAQYLRIIYIFFIYILYILNIIYLPLIPLMGKEMNKHNFHWASTNNIFKFVMECSMHVCNATS